MANNESSLSSQVKAPILSQYLFDSGNLCQPAQTLAECTVSHLDGTKSNNEERIQQTSNIDSQRKRQRTDYDYDNDNTTPSPSSILERSAEIFLSSGCCVIRNAVLPAHFVKQCHERATSDLRFLTAQLEKRRDDIANINNEDGHIDPHQLAAVHRVDFRELVDRDGSRRDVRFNLHRFPYSAYGLIYNSTVFSLVQELLGGGEVNLLYMGVMWAMPSCDKQPTPQKWHGDGGHLFEHAHQPPHCINVFYPLVDLTAANGPTEVKPGSHRLGKFSDPTQPTFALECRAGDAILFDYRLKHRGAANQTTQPRPILYLAYAKPWFRDAGNIRSAQSLVVPPSKSWVARILRGKALPNRIDGFDNLQSRTTEGTENTSLHEHSNQPEQPDSLIGNDIGAGERWILFKMNVELDGGKEATITVYHGDVPLEVSTQFCLEHGLAKDFISVLAETIQQQMLQQQQNH